MEIEFGEALLLILAIALFFAWLLVLFAITGDVFRDHALPGWSKAAWIFAIVFLPFLGALVYLVARGGEMRERSLKEREDVKSHFDNPS